MAHCLVVEDEPTVRVLVNDLLETWGHDVVPAATGGEAIARLRERLVVGHGSCSLDEPVEDLVALGVLSHVGEGLA